MTKTLHNLYQAQQALDLAESPAEAVQALHNILEPLLGGATLDITLDTDSVVPELAPHVLEAIKTQEPQLDSKGNRLAVPLVVEKRSFGFVTIERKQPLTSAELALILGQTQIAAVALDRFSWPASPLVFRQLVENANVAIDVADLGGKLTYANQAAATMYGYTSPDEMLGRQVSDLYYDNEDERVRSRMNKIVAGGWIGEVIQRHTSGDPFPVELAIFGLHDPRHKTSSFGAILQDVAEYHRLVKELQEKTRRLESLNRVSILLSSSLDRNRVLSLAAEQMMRLMEVDHCGIALIDEPGVAAHMVAEYPPTVLAGSALSLHNNALLAEDSLEDAFVSVDAPNDPRLEPIRDALNALGVKSILTVRLEVKDKVIGSIGLDCIHEYREFTEDEIETCRTLASQIALAMENSDLYGQALIATRLKSEFMTNISHELRTPLNAILGYTEGILAGLYGPLTAKQTDRLQRVFHNAQGLLALISDVLDLSEIQAGKMTLELKPQEIEPIITSVVSQVAPLAESKKLTLSTELPPALPRISADTDRLKQIILNLVTNAVKFTREGRVKIDVEPLTIVNGQCEEHPLDAELDDGHWLAVAVEDTGIGIAPENFEIIFDAFRQVDGSTIREFQGTGLGLAITQQLVEMHGGKLWVESEVHRGSRFTFALPIDQSLKRSA